MPSLLPSSRATRRSRSDWPARASPRSRHQREPEPGFAQDEGLFGELGQRHPPPAPPGVAGGDDEHDAVGGEAAELQCRGVGLAADQANVGLAVLDLAQHRLGVGDGGPDLDVRMDARKAPSRSGSKCSPGIELAASDSSPVRGSLVAGDLFEGLPVQAQDAFGEGVEALAGDGEGNTAGAMLEERHAEGAFQRPGCAG